MRIWFDTEFIEDGKTIDLISIGAIREDGATYYAEAAECDRSRASQWVVDNVFPYLDSEAVKPRAQIAADLIAFVGPSPKFWAYYADYDWVVLCQLYGTMMDLPHSWPMYCRDVKQMADALGITELPPTYANEHNALSDARWTKKAWAHIGSVAAGMDAWR